MHIITRRRLREFAARFRDAEKPLAAWYHMVKRGRYANPNDVRVDFPTASFLGAHRTVFNIGGNKFRLVVDMRYRHQRVYIVHVQTHAEYDDKTKDGTL